MTKMKFTLQVFIIFTLYYSINSLPEPDDGPITLNRPIKSNLKRDPNCPYPSDIITYDYVPGNCTAYYECDHGNRYLFNCPSPYEWNHIMNYCDYAENVDCNRNDSTTERPSTIPDPGLCIGQPDGTLIANIHDCTTFYECLRGESILMHCSPGLEWHDSIKTCDYPANAQCTPKF